jgi:hypothetical protein
MCDWVAIERVEVDISSSYKCDLSLKIISDYSVDKPITYV